MCPSGMAVTEHAARAIMCGEGDIMIASGAEDHAESAPVDQLYSPRPRLFNRYPQQALNMGYTAETVAELWKGLP